MNNIALINTAIQVPSFILAIFLILIILVFGINYYRIKQKRKYSFKNEFPYELAQGVGDNFKTVFHVLILVYAVALIFFTFYTLNEVQHWTSMTLLISNVVTALITYLIFTTNVRSMKKQMMFTAIYLVLTLLNALSLGFYFQFFLIEGNQNAIYFYVTAYVIAAISALLILNPRLAKWSYMDKIEQQDGTITILRPKWFPLAYSQWALVIINIILISLLFVATMIYQ